MSVIITIGNADPNDRLGESLALPLIPQIDAVGQMQDALDQVVTERKGVVVVGGKGAGKTVARRRAVERFLTGERLAEAQDARYRKRHVLVVHGVRAVKYREVLLVLLKQLVGTAVPDRVRGRAKTDAEILEEFVHHCFSQRVAALVVDEGETLSPAALTLLRDVMADAEDADPARGADGDLAAAGIGVLLIGTEAVLTRLALHEERQQRWVRHVAVGRIAPALVPTVYETWFPGFAAHVTAAGRPTWETYLATAVSKGRDVPLRWLENHARLYWRRLCHNREQLGLPGVVSRETAPFHQGVFEYTLKEVQWGGAANERRRQRQRQRQRRGRRCRGVRARSTSSPAATRSASRPSSSPRRGAPGRGSPTTRSRRRSSARTASR